MRKIRKILLKKIVLFLFTVNMIYAQSYDWVKVDSVNITTNPTYLIRSVDLDTSGNIISSRIENSKLVYNTSYLGNCLIEKFDIQGNLIWDKKIFGKVNIIDIKVDLENNIYAAGAYRDSIIVDSNHYEINNLSQNHGFVFKLNSSGQAQWLKDFTDINPDYYSINAMNLDNTNSIWISVRKLHRSTFLQKLDSQGNVLQTIEQTDVIGLSGFDFDPFGNIYVTGAASSGQQSFNGFNANAPFSYNVYIAKYSNNGSASWVKFIEDVTFQEPVIQCDNDGNSYLSASLFDSISFGGLTVQGPDWVYDFYLTKIDSSGNFVWVKEVPAGNGLTGDATIGQGQHLSIDNYNNVYLSGFFRGDVDWGNGVISSSSDFYYASFINKYSSAGNIIWTKTASSPGYDRADDIAIDKNNNIYLTGITSDSVSFDSLIFRSTFASTFLTKITQSPVSIISGELNKIPVNIKLFENYPNPFNPATTIQFELDKNSYVILSIFNILGQKVETIISDYLNVGKHKFFWNAQNYSSGIYFMQIESGNIALTRKITLLK